MPARREVSTRRVPRVSVQCGAVDVAAEIAWLESQPGVGAIVSFTGLCRDEGGRIAALEIEHYPAMAETELQRIASEAMARWPLSGLTIIHRTGRVAVGERIVLVVTAAAHRVAAFQAAEFVMDYLKTRAPFWKKSIWPMNQAAVGSRPRPPTTRR